jgi:hypothetical protein
MTTIVNRKHHLTVNQGATFSNTFVINTSDESELDVTGYTANGMIRRHYSSTNAVAFSCSLANGSLTISLSANQTANLTSTRYVYDVIITDANGAITRVQEGQLFVSPSVTR